MSGEPKMELKPQTAKVVGLATCFDPVGLETPLGQVRWATVQIDYAMAGLSPSVTIRVPVSVDQGAGEAELHSQALRNARLLIDHACRASGIGNEEPAAGPVQSLIAEMEGLAQELGLSDPTTRPKRPVRRRG
jgi:hypothetical protein